MIESTFQEIWKLPAWGKTYACPVTKEDRSARSSVSLSNISQFSLRLLSQAGLLTKNRTLKTSNTY